MSPTRTVSVRSPARLTDHLLWDSHVDESIVSVDAVWSGPLEDKELGLRDTVEETFTVVSDELE